MHIAGNSPGSSDVAGARSSCAKADGSADAMFVDTRDLGQTGCVT